MHHTIPLGFVLVILCQSPAISQGPEKPSRLDVTLSGGGSFPLGDFASASGDRAGFASAGYAFSAAMTYRAYGVLDVGGHIAFSSNPFDTDRFSDVLGIPNGRFEAGTYFNTGFLAMAGVTLAVGPSVDYYARAYGGVMWCQSPEFKGTWTGITGVLLPSGAGFPLAYGIGTGVRFRWIDVSARYFRAEPEYEVDLSGAIARLTQPTDFIQLTVGYVIRVKPGY